jgi:hypothetical protein
LFAGFLLSTSPIHSTVHFMSEEPFPDYYAILQVHPSAEAEIIEVAYRRLMRKYHPDSLPPELRQDADILVRVRSINIAYDTLSDPVQRAAYDFIYFHKGKDETEVNSEIETKIIKIRCAQSRQTYRMLIGRKPKTEKLFRVLGFEADDHPVQPEPSIPPVASILALPAPNEPTNLLQKIQKFLIPSKKENPQMTGKPAPRFPTPAEIHAMYEEPSRISFSQINWAGWRCPACDGTHTLPNGVTTNWCRCSRCNHIYCAGNMKDKLGGSYTHCPWCNRTARITMTVKLGDPGDMPVSGEMKRASTSGQNKPSLQDRIQARLPGNRKQ